jgi:tRNA dimethylallyltransferase
MIVVAGPTASGKTRCAISLAKIYGGEIVSADSMQIYRGFDIGSAKPSARELAEATHHLVGCVDPREDFSVAVYQKLAREAIAGIYSRGGLPIVAGGAGLYVNSILYDMDFCALPKQEATRAALWDEAEKKGGGVLHERLKSLDPAAARRIHPNNVKKVVRALEALEHSGGKTGLNSFDEAFTPYPGYSPLIIGLTREREELYARINARVDRLLEAGLVREVEELVRGGLSMENISMKGIGYKEIFNYLTGSHNLERAVYLIKQNSRRYAKRQLTWFRRYPNINWFNISSYGGEKDALDDIADFCAKAMGKI